MPSQSTLTPWQVIDPHTHQYLDRLRDEPLFLALAQKVSDYMSRCGDHRGLARTALRRVEHFNHKTDAVYETMRRLAVAQHEAANLVQACCLLFSNAKDMYTATYTHVCK